MAIKLSSNAKSFGGDMPADSDCVPVIRRGSSLGDQIDVFGETGATNSKHFADIRGGILLCSTLSEFMTDDEA
jgi:hypothetical protein